MEYTGECVWNEEQRICYSLDNTFPAMRPFRFLYCINRLCLSNTVALENNFVSILILIYFFNRQLVSKDEKLKLGLSFVYDAPPGFKGF